MVAFYEAKIAMLSSLGERLEAQLGVLRAALADGGSSTSPELDAVCDGAFGSDAILGRRSLYIGQDSFSAQGKAQLAQGILTGKRSVLQQEMHRRKHLLESAMKAQSEVRDLLRRARLTELPAENDESDEVDTSDDDDDDELLDTVEDLFMAT
jgi:hypothetical protein